MSRHLRLYGELSSKPLYTVATQHLLSQACKPITSAAYRDVIAIRQTFMRDSTDKNIAHLGWLGLACTQYVTTFLGLPTISSFRFEPGVRQLLAPLTSEIQSDEALLWVITVFAQEMIRPDFPVMYINATLFPDAIILNWHDSQRKFDGHFDENNTSKIDKFPDQSGLIILERPASVESQCLVKSRLLELLPTYRSLLNLPTSAAPDCYISWPFNDHKGV